MQKINTFQDKRIKQVQALREAQERRVTGLTLIDGAREIERAMEAGVDLREIYYVKSFDSNLLTKLSAYCKVMFEVTEKIFEKIAYGKRDEGVVAVARIPVLTLKDLRLSKHPLVVIVESVEKPGNLGAILRTCDGVGVEAVLVCDPKTDIFNPNTIRSSTGVIFSMPIVMASAGDILNFLKSKNIAIAAAALVDEAKAYTELKFKDGWAFVFGREDLGLSDFWLKAADYKMMIPMKGKADSLNVSTAAAVILYEALRQRQVD